MFVGITRAQEELHLSRAGYREFRGREVMTVPSQFLMELPREEMDESELAPTATDWEQPTWSKHAQADESQPASSADSESVDDSFDRSDGTGADSLAVCTDNGIEPMGQAGRVGSVISPTISAPLATAAELARQRPAELPPAAPEEFYQGMLVRHPEYGLGKVVALSGVGERRTATVAFASGAGQKKFVLHKSVLRPVKSR